MTDDEGIIDLLFARSEEAIEKLDRKYGNLCRKISIGILKDRRDAEECINDAYAAVWNSIPPTRPHSLQAYLCKIVRHISLNRYHKNEAAKRNSAYAVSLRELEEVLSSPNTVESELEAKEIAGIIEEFLSGQTKENRVIFVLRYGFSFSYADIAKKVGISEKNVSVRLTRIRKQMKAYLTEREVL